MSLKKQKHKEKNLLFASALDLIKVYNPWIIGTINCNGSKRAIVLMWPMSILKILMKI